MARENQGLQIALIIFVMLTIVLGVTTFLFYRRYDEALRASIDARENENKAISATTAKEDECARLKRIIGMSGKATEQVEEQHKADMNNFGANNYPEDARYYSPMLTRLWEVIDDKGKQVKDLEIKLQDLKSRYETRESIKDKQIAQMDAAVKASGAEVEKVTGSFTEQREQILADQTKLAAQVDKVRVERRAAVEKAEDNVKKTQAQLGVVIKMNKDKAEIIDGIKKQTMDNPAGEVRWVNQHNATVWINLGRADALERQISFAVYSGDASDLGKATKKASIEVTKILGDHMAEAKILEDKITDPIMPGDKLYTPLWSPGQQTHFALAGIMDLDGDGRNAIETVKNLITMSGGVVDCVLDEKGKQTGEITLQTRFLVLGKEPAAEGMSGWSHMIDKAKDAGARTMTLAELKERTGYKRQATVERFGRAAGAGDMRPKAAPAKKPAAKAAAAAE